MASWPHRGLAGPRAIGGNGHFPPPPCRAARTRHNSPVSTPLSRFVEAVQTTESGASAARIDRLPDGRTLLVFRVVDGRADLTVAGARRRAHFKSTSGLSHALILQFKPGWSASVLGVPAHVLTDRFVALEELWGPAG